MQIRTEQNRTDICNQKKTPVKQLACRVDEVAINLVHLNQFPHKNVERKKEKLRAEKGYKKFVVMKTMEYIQTNVSSARNSFLKHDHGHKKHQISRDSNESLTRGSGICGNHIAVFLAVMQELGIQARSIQFWYEYKPDVRFSHIASEVFYDNRWHYFDITWATFFTDKKNSIILSIDEIMTRGDTQRHTNSTNVWFMNAKKKMGIDGVFSYLHKNADITKDEIGVVTAYHQEKGDGLYSMPLLHIPNYVGDNKADGKHAGISYRFTVPAGTYKVNLELLAKAGCGKSSLYVNDKKVSFTGKQASLIINNPKTAQVKGQDDVCYYVLKNIKMMKTN